MGGEKSQDDYPFFRVRAEDTESLLLDHLVSSQANPERGGLCCVFPCLIPLLQKDPNYKKKKSRWLTKLCSSILFSLSFLFQFGKCLQKRREWSFSHVPWAWQLSVGDRETRTHGNIIRKSSDLTLVKLHCSFKANSTLFGTCFQSKNKNIACPGQNQAWRHILPSLGQVRQEDHKFKVSLSSVLSPCLK